MMDYVKVQIAGITDSFQNWVNTIDSKYDQMKKDKDEIFDKTDNFMNDSTREYNLFIDQTRTELHDKGFAV